MSRQFGLSRRETSLGALGKSPGALARGTQRDSIFLSPSSPFERRQIGKPSFDERELGAGFLFFAMVIAPLLFVGLIVLCNRTFVP